MTATAAKDTWPKTKGGSVDWEVVFESAEQGLIPLIETANAPSKLQRCALLVIEQLFSRDDDGEAVKTLQTSLDRLFSQAYNSGGDDEATLLRHKALIATFLREIKTQRIERANNNERDKIDAAQPELPAEYKKTPAAKPKTDAYPDVGYAGEVEGAFAEVFCSMMMDRFEVLRADMNNIPKKALPPPFFMSPEFTERYRRILLKRFVPHLTKKWSGMIRRAEKEQPEKQRASLVKSFESRNDREILWQAWQDIWRICTEQQEFPKKPAEDKKGLGGMFKKKESAGIGNAMTLDEWKGVKKRIKAENKAAKKIWAEIIQPSGAYRAPTDADSKFLMALFARTPTAIDKQINALRQIAEQGGNAGRSFDEYRQGKDIDLPLTVISYQRPDLFLLGKKNLLKDFVRGYKDHQRKESLPLTTRHLSPFM